MGMKLMAYFWFIITSNFVNTNGMGLLVCTHVVCSKIYIGDGRESRYSKIKIFKDQSCGLLCSSEFDPHVYGEKFVERVRLI